MSWQETLHLLFIVCMFIAICTCKLCTNEGPCTCRFDDGSGVVDLTSLGNTDDTPRFQDVPAENDDNLYSYNPCGGFEEERGCTDAALCMLSSDKSEIQQLGEASSTDFKYDEDSGHVIAGYLSRGVALQYSEIEMICDANACEPEFVAIGRSSGEAAYKMQLTTVCACAGMCIPTGPIKCSPAASSTSAISVGSIFLIGLFACLIFYMLGGVVYMKVHKKATGSELIPNKEIWKSFPSLVALCMLSSDKSEIQQLGEASSTDFKYDDDSGHVIAGYLSRGVALQYSEIEMICDANACEPEFVAVGRSSGEAAYKMQLTTVCACAGMCTPTGPIKCSPAASSTSAISVGSIFLIGLFACLIFYMLGGVVYMKVHKKATGSELIPNKEIWKSFPSLVAGGFKFLYSKCAPNRRGYTSSG